MVACLQVADSPGLVLLRVDFNSVRIIAGRYKDSVDQGFTDDPL